MDAEEARRLTEINLKGPVIEPYVEFIDRRIKGAAERGKNSILNPQHNNYGQHGFHLSGEDLKAVRMYFEEMGFTWTDHPNPDPGHPASAPYTTLSW
jgi:hypothetical protein